MVQKMSVLNNASIDTFWTCFGQKVSKSAQNVPKIWTPVQNVSKKCPYFGHLSKM